MRNESGLAPLEFNVVVKPDALETKTAGGIILIEKERDKLAVCEGELIAISPLAFTYAEWPEGTSPPTVGSRVMFRRYAGTQHTRDKVDYRIITDKDIVAVVDTTPALSVAA